MANVPNLHVLRVKYLGPTNSRGSRVKIISDRFKQSVTIPFNHALNNPEDMAVRYLEHLTETCTLSPCPHPQGFNIIGIAEGYVITDTFLPLKS